MPQVPPNLAAASEAKHCVSLRSAGMLLRSSHLCDWCGWEKPQSFWDAVGILWGTQLNIYNPTGIILCKPWKHRLYEERGCQECCTLVSEVSAQHGRDSKKDRGSSTCGIDAFDYLPRKSSPDQELPGLVNQTQNSRPNSLG